MELKYYGTAAAGGIPEMFCSCRVCNEARINRGKDMRTRSQATIDDKLCLDFSVDSYLHTLYGGFDVRKIKHILVTHAHYDHFLHQEFFSRAEGMTEPCRIYVSEGSSEKLMEVIERREAAIKSGKKIKTTDFELDVHIIKPFEPFEISGYKVTPLEAHHGKGVDPLVYIIESDGKSLLWAHDTGLLPKSTIDYLRDCNITFDCISLDCTLGRGEYITPSHMDIERCAQTVNILKEMGRVNSQTRVLISHISHLLHRTHDELVREASEFGMEVAYDGMKVII